MAALQVKDLGSIRWKNGNQFSRSGNTAYQGIEGIDFLNLDENIFNQIRDTIRSLANVDKTTVSYTRSLRASLQAENQFYFSERWTAGLAAGYTFQREYWFLMAGGVYRPIAFWSLGGQLSYDSRNDWSLGILTALELGAFNLFFTTDHLPALWNLKQADRFQVRIGMALMWD